MIVKDIIPSAPLQEYIQQYRLRHFVFPKGVMPTVKPFPPRPEQCLTFFVRGHETAQYANGLELKKPRSVLSGQFTGRVDRFVSYPEVLMIIVDFKPGGLYRLINIPFHEFADKDIDAETIFSCELQHVNSRLSGCESYAQMIQLVEEFLLSLVAKSTKAFSAMDQLFSRLMKEPNHSIDQLARDTYLSTRQLERKFDEYIGISPKMFLRICRFNQSYWMYLKNSKINLSQIAISCGYTDYQHLVKEYKQFANESPTRFFMEERNAPGRVLGLNK